MFSWLVVSNPVHLETSKTSHFELSNVTKITRLAIPGFRSIECAQFLPIKWHHECKHAQNFSTERAPFWAPLWPHLMGKPSFPWSALIGPKPGNSQPCYFNNIGIKWDSSSISSKEYDYAFSKHLISKSSAFLTSSKFQNTLQENN